MDRAVRLHTASYRRFRDGVRAYYRAHMALTADARANLAAQSGQWLVSPLCHEPRVALAVLHGLLAPHIERGQLQLLLSHELQHAVLMDRDDWKRSIRSCCWIARAA